MTRFVLLSTVNFSRMRAISYCLSPCITDQWDTNYPSYVSIRLIWNCALNALEYLYMFDYVLFYHSFHFHTYDSGNARKKENVFFCFHCVEELKRKG